MDIARENYLVNGHAEVLASRPDFRKLLDHEQITAAERPHALTPESQPHRDDRRELVLDDQEEWAHVDH
jgi:hypothetical protein